MQNMDLSYRIRKFGWLGREELMYSIFCSGIAASLVFWPLINSLICLALAAYWLLVSKKEFTFHQAKSRWAVLFSLLFVVALAGTFYSHDLSTAFVQLQRKIALLAFPLVFGTASVISPLVFKRTLLVLVWSAFFGCMFCIIHGFYGYVSHGVTNQLYGYQMVALKDMPPYILGLCCLLSLVYLLNQLSNAHTNRSGVNRADITLSVFFFCFLFLLGNRNILICMSGAIIYYCFRLLDKVINRILILCCLALIFILAIIFNPSLDRQWNDMIDFSKANNIPFGQDQTLNRSWGGKTIRLTIWRCSLDIIKQHWIAGVGTGDVQTALQQAYENRKFYFASRYNTYNAHNQYIQETIAYGLFGFLIFMSGIISPLLLGYTQKRDTFYVIFILCFAFVCLTESVLELNKGIIWYSFFNSMLMFRKI